VEVRLLLVYQVLGGRLPLISRCSQDCLALLVVEVPLELEGARNRLLHLVEVLLSEYGVEVAQGKVVRFILFKLSWQIIANFP
jgi:hypothetical protein